MEKQKINFSYKQLVSKFRFRGDIMGNADLLWRSSLWFFLFALIAIITLGYLTYEWAVSADESHVPAKTERPTLSLTSFLFLPIFAKHLTNGECPENVAQW